MAKSRSGFGLSLSGSGPGRLFSIPNPEINPPFFTPSPDQIQPGKIWVFGMQVLNSDWWIQLKKNLNSTEKSNRNTNHFSKSNTNPGSKQTKYKLTHLFHYCCFFAFESNRSCFVFESNRSLSMREVGTFDRIRVG